MNPCRANILLTTALVSLSAGVLLRFPPEQYSFYPTCPIHDWLHLQCPGCGATRALAALLHGHLGAALDDNLLVVAFLPLLLGYATLCCTRAWRNVDFRWPQPPPWAINATLVLAALFTLARNLQR